MVYSSGEDLFFLTDLKRAVGPMPIPFFSGQIGELHVFFIKFGVTHRTISCVQERCDDTKHARKCPNKCQPLHEMRRGHVAREIAVNLYTAGA